jgi:hypothetical protein
MHRIARFLTIIIALVLIAGLAGTVTAKGRHTHASSAPAASKKIPASLKPPAGAVFLFESEAKGVQIYACEAKPEAPTTFTWTFKAPEAELRNARGEVIATHFAGPTWQGNDGSTVVAAVLARADAPSKKDIPWLLLEAKSHTGSGAFSTIIYIQRLDTRGGIAPAAGCDGTHANAETHVPYEAVYAFYYPAAS